MDTALILVSLTVQLVIMGLVLSLNVRLSALVDRLDDILARPRP